MTPEAQRIAIAEACGWKIESYSPMDHKRPHWINDIRVMFDARKACIVGPKLRAKYMNTLRKIVGRRCEVNKVGQALVSDYDCMDANSREHAEAFLKTLNLWDDSK